MENQETGVLHYYFWDSSKTVTTITGEGNFKLMY